VARSRAGYTVTGHRPAAWPRLVVRVGGKQGPALRAGLVGAPSARCVVGDCVPWASTRPHPAVKGSLSLAFGALDSGDPWDGRWSGRE
jgi:hypothetical protein